MSISTFFVEVSSSMGKRFVAKKEQTPSSMGFLSFFWMFFGYGVAAMVYPAWWIFALASLPTVAIRVVLEIIQAHVTMRAIAVADRSTYSFLRIVTIPLLLIVDIFLGYHISVPQMFGITLIVLVLVLLTMNHGISRKGAGLVLFTAINGTITISLYKYHIDNFNSVVAEQFIMLSFIVLYFTARIVWHEKKNPIRLLTNKHFFLQSFSSGLSSILGSFAYVFAPASIITAVKRSSLIMWSIISGRAYFHESHLYKKLFGFMMLAVAIVLFLL